MEYILNSFPVTEKEYEQLEKLFGDLAHYAAWQLIKKNVKNNHTDDPEDIAQEIRLASIKAGSYFKRQVYLEKCLIVAKKFAKTKNIKDAIDKLEDLWKNRTKHGANRQKFGEPEERLLQQIILSNVPEEERPRKDQPLEMNCKFITYCKAIIWNRQKSLGKKITREKTIRSGAVSLSEFDYLSGSRNDVMSQVE